MRCYRCGEVIKKWDFCSACGSVLRYPCVNGRSGGTSTRLAQNTAGSLTYLAWWITGIIFYVIETNRFVRFHAIQSILAFGAITVLLTVIRIVRGAIWDMVLRTGGNGYALWSLFGFISIVIWIGTLVLWVILMVRANQGETFKLPIVGDIAEKQLSRN